MRTTTDRKSNDLRIRLNESMYRHLVAESSRVNKSLSEYIRWLIEKDIADKGKSNRS